MYMYILAMNYSAFMLQPKFVGCISSLLKLYYYILWVKQCIIFFVFHGMLFPVYTMRLHNELCMHHLGQNI